PRLFAVAVSMPNTSTCEVIARASLPRASSPAALIASCGQYVGCAYPTARSFPFTLSGILSTQEGTTMPSLYGFPHRFNFGAGCGGGPLAHARTKLKHTAILQLAIPEAPKMLRADPERAGPRILHQDAALTSGAWLPRR